MSYLMEKHFKPLELCHIIQRISSFPIFQVFVLDKHFSELCILTVLTFDKQHSLETMWTHTQDEQWNLSVVILPIKRIFSVPPADSSKVSGNCSAFLTKIQTKISFPC